MVGECRNTRIGRRPNQEAEDNANYGAVANVNKTRSDRRGPSKSPKVVQKRPVVLSPDPEVDFPNKRRKEHEKLRKDQPAAMGRSDREKSQAESSKSAGQGQRLLGDRMRTVKANFRDGQNQMTMMVQQHDEEGMAEPNLGDYSDPENPLDYFDDVDNQSEDTTDSVKILRLTDEERAERIKELDVEMSGKMMELHQLMYDGGLTETMKFMQ